MPIRIGMLLLLVGALAGAAWGQAVPSGEPVPTAPAADGSWLDRTLQRYFGDDAPTGEAIGGLSLELVDRYAQHAGKPIEVVIVSQVDAFDDVWTAGLGTGKAVLQSVTTPLQAYTRDSTIRQYLLFRQGDTVDPFRFADTERLLRSLDYIEDVRILVIPLDGGIESVAVVVETRDRWPFGVAGTVKGVGWYEASIYSSNLGGTGLRFENKILARQGLKPDVGYRGVLQKQNLAASFIDGTVEYEDSYRRLQAVVAFQRGIAHPAIRAVGGISFRRVQEREVGPEPDEREVGDYWGGWALPLTERPEAVSTARPLLVPAVRFDRTIFLDRPTVGRDLLRNYHNNQNYLFGITLQRLKYYKTSFLFGMGETENLPSGIVSKVSGGYQDGEFHDRAQFWLQNSLLNTRNQGDVLSLRANYGGFLRNGVFEDGRLNLGSTYITSLQTKGHWRYRLLFRVNYLLGINSTSEQILQLGDEAGLRGMDNNRVYGNQRLVGSLEHRAFTPWSLLGFRFMLLGFLDVGTIADENEALLAAKFYLSAGLGVRIRNPDLVLPAVQLRVAFLNSIDDKGVLVGFKVGNIGLPDIVVPSPRPGGFEFR